MPDKASKNLSNFFLRDLINQNSDFFNAILEKTTVFLNNQVV